MNNRKIMTSLVVALLCLAMIGGGYSTWLVLVNPQAQTQTGGVVELNVSEKKVSVTATIPSNLNSNSDYAAFLESDGQTYGNNWMKVENATSYGMAFDLEVNLRPDGSTWADWITDETKYDETIKFKIWLTEFKTLTSGGTTEVDSDRKLLKDPTTGTDTWIEVLHDGTTWTAIIQGATPTGWDAEPNFDDDNGRLTLSLTPSWGEAFNYNNPNAYINSKETYSNTEFNSDKAKLDALAQIQKFSIAVNAQVVPVSGS